MEQFRDVVQDPFGNVVEGAEITVVDAAGNLATLYSDQAGTQPIASLKSDVRGSFAFFVASGTYTVRIAAANLPTREIRLVIQDPAELLRYADVAGSFVASGLLPSVPVPASLTAATPTGVAYVTGRRIVPAATNHTYPISSDVYVDVSSLGAYTYTAVGNGAGAPAVAPDSMRLFKVVTDATEITAVTDLRARDVPFVSANGFTFNGGSALKKIVHGSALLDFGNVAAGATVSQPIGCAGAKAGMPVKLGYVTHNAGLVYQPQLNADDVVTVYATNVTGAPIATAPQTFRAEVTNY